MKIHLHAIGAVALASLAASSMACSPIKTFGLVFERNSDHVPAAEVLKLAKWTAELRQRYPNRQAIFMTTQAAYEETHPRQLGIRRMHRVWSVLTDTLQFDVRETYPLDAAYAAAAAAPPRSRLVQRVDLDFLPACPHECPCQRDDPLYQPEPAR